MDLSHLLKDIICIQGINFLNYLTCSDSKTIKIFAQTQAQEVACIKCHFPRMHNHGWRRKVLQIPPLCAYNQAFLDICYERFKCPVCSHTQTNQKFLSHAQFPGFSTSFVEVAGRLMEETTCAAASRLLGCNAKTLWSMDNSRTKVLKDHFEIPKDLDVSRMSADEVHFKTQKNLQRRHPFDAIWDIQFITNLVATQHRKVIANHQGRQSQSLRNCLRSLSKDQLSKIKFFALDMHAGFMSVIQKHCPNADICVDRFHLVQKMNEAFDAVRRSELWKAKKLNDEFQESMLSPGRKFIFFDKNPNLTFEENSLLNKLKMLNTEIHNGMMIVDYFHKVLDEKYVGNFRGKLCRWYRMVREGKNRHMIKFASLVRKYRLQIENYIKSNLTTAVSEGLNNKIRVLKAMAYHYSNEESYMNKILQRCGFLNSRSIDTTPLYWNSDFGTKPVHQ